MKAIIVEGEATTVNNLETVLAQNAVTQIEVIAELEDIGGGVDFFRTLSHPDVTFTDVYLADGSAFKMFEQAEIDVPMVFATAYNEYALQTFQVSSVDYLLKPVTLASLEKALNKLRLFDTKGRLVRVRQTNRTAQSHRTIENLLIMLTDKFYLLAVEGIPYFYTANGRVTAYTFDGKQHPVDRTLGTLRGQLGEKPFFQVDRQFIISRNTIKDIDLWFGSRLSTNLTLLIPERIIISKARAPIFKEWILREEK